jgi:hypothetical protein
MELDAAERVVPGATLRNRLVRAVLDYQHFVVLWKAYVAPLSE